MKLQVGDLVTVDNYRTGKPYKKYYGLLTDIVDRENNEKLASIETGDRNFIFSYCKVEWIFAPSCYGAASINATFIREYNNV